MSTEVVQLIRDYLLYFYDLKLKVGHGSRCVGECIKLANESMETKTALMEARFVTGQKRPLRSSAPALTRNAWTGRKGTF